MTLWLDAFANQRTPEASMPLLHAGMVRVSVLVLVV